jgi:hypothetical protein
MTHTAATFVGVLVKVIHVLAVQVKTMLLPANMSGAEKREKM